MLDDGAFRGLEKETRSGAKGGVSVAWARYISAVEFKEVTDRLMEESDPSESGVVKLLVSDVENLPSLTVEHDPWTRDSARPDLDHFNDAHSLIFGDGYDAEEREWLVEISTWEIRPSGR